MFGYAKPNQRDVADNYPKQSQLSTGESAGYTNQTAFASELLGTESLRSRRASDPPVHIPGDVAFELNCRRGRLDRGRPQPVSGDISPKQTVAICIRRVSIQSDLSATRIVAAT